MTCRAGLKKRGRKEERACNECKCSIYYYLSRVVKLRKRFLCFREQTSTAHPSSAAAEAYYYGVRNSVCKLCLYAFSN